jgi:hypothetical protein
MLSVACKTTTTLTSATVAPHDMSNPRKMKTIVRPIAANASGPALVTTELHSKYENGSGNSVCCQRNMPMQAAIATTNC